jgi:hypothetical protein
MCFSTSASIPRPAPLSAPSRHDNPFATCWTRPGAVPFHFPLGNSADQLIEKLRAENWCGEIIGPHGSGKSTLLEALQPKLRAACQEVYQITLRHGQRRLPYSEIPLPWINQVFKVAQKSNFRTNMPTGYLLIIDGYEQLGWTARWRLKRWCRRASVGLLVTAHRPTGLPTLIQLAPDRRLIEQLVAHLCANIPSAISPMDIAASHACHGVNVREVLFDLYDPDVRR